MYYVMCECSAAVKWHYWKSIIQKETGIAAKVDEVDTNTVSYWNGMCYCTVCVCVCVCVCLPGGDVLSFSGNIFQMVSSSSLLSCGSLIFAMNIDAS